MTLNITIGILLILLGTLMSWGSLRGLTNRRSKPRQRIDPSVFTVMELQALEFHPKAIPLTNLPRNRKESLKLDSSLQETDTPSTAIGLFGKSPRSGESLPGSTLHIRAQDSEPEGDPKTLGL